MNIYEKINAVKLDFLKANVKKTGKNKHSGFEYYELSDLQPTITRLCSEHKLYTQVTFTQDVARMYVIDIEKPEDVITFESPMKEISIAGSNAIQSLGGVETYQRRYLLLMAFDITEPDTFDALAGSPANKEESITSEQVQWIEKNCDVPALLSHLGKGRLTDLTKTTATSVINAKKRQMEAGAK